MSLASTMSTALTGLNASDTQIDIIGNNLANANTVGFKASDVLFATQFLQTQSVGSSPTAANGGNNPQQTGLGVQVAEITPNFSQGTISTANSPTDLAIQGDGFFIVQGENGEQNYTRNGTFTANAENQLVTGTGNRVMGYGINNNFQIDSSTLVPLSIPLGTATVAKATTKATLEGSLTPDGTIANTASILQTSPLTDGSITYPGNGWTTPANGLTATQTADATGKVAANSYDYYVTFVNGTTQSKPQSLAASVTVSGANGGEVQLSNLPTDTSGDWTGMTIYRSVAGSTNCYAIPNPGGGFEWPLGTTSVTDNNADSSLTANPVLNTSGSHISNPTAVVDTSGGQPVSGNLNGTYQYYVTFYNSTSGTESRPQLVPTTSPTLNGGQVVLSNLPAPNSGTWTSERIYRTTNDVPGDTNAYEIADIPLNTATANGFTYTDNNADESIRDGGLPTPSGFNPTQAKGSNILSFDGPAVSSTTLLQNVVEYNSSTGTYQNVFSLPAATAEDKNPTATLSFTGTKGGNSLPAQTFTISDTSTLKDLANFLQGALGIQTPPGNDPSNPIPDDSVSGEAPGVTITTKNSTTSAGCIQIVGDDGTPNSVAIGLSALQLTSGDPPTTSNVSLPFNSIQSAAGQGVATSMVAYDSLGTPLSVNITAVLQSVTSSATTYRWYADCPQNDPGSGQQQGIAVGTGTVSFDGEGNFLSASNTTITIGRANEPSVNPLQFNLDFSQVSGLASTTASLSVASQDGSAPGVLSSFTISGTGLISGVFSNGISQNLGQIQLARFTNPAGLEQTGQNMYATGVNSGLPITGDPGAQGTGTIVAGSLELSNTDIGASLIHLITASTMYQANSRVITTTTQLFNDLLQLGR